MYFDPSAGGCALYGKGPPPCAVAVVPVVQDDLWDSLLQACPVFFFSFSVNFQVQPCYRDAASLSLVAHLVYISSLSMPIIYLGASLHSLLCKTGDYFFLTDLVHHTCRFSPSSTPWKFRPLPQSALLLLVLWASVGPPTSSGAWLPTSPLAQESYQICCKIMAIPEWWMWAGCWYCWLWPCYIRSSVSQVNCSVSSLLWCRRWGMRLLLPFTFSYMPSDILLLSWSCLPLALLLSNPFAVHLCITVFTARASLMTLLGPTGMAQICRGRGTSSIFFSLTFLLLALTYAAALSFTNLSLILGFIGAIGIVPVSLTLPSLYLVYFTSASLEEENEDHDKRQNGGSEKSRRMRKERLLQILGYAGVVLGVSMTVFFLYGTLMS